MSPNPPAVNDWPARYAPASADFNLYIRDAFTFLQNPPVMRAVQTSTQSCASGVYTSIAFDTMEEDNYSGYSTSSARYTAQVPGWYFVMTTILTATAGSSVNSAGFRLTLDGIDWRVNSTVPPFTYGGVGQGATLLAWQAWEYYYMLAGDSLGPVFYNASGGSISTSAGGTDDARSSFSVMWVSE